MSKDRIKIVQGRYCRYLTFFCPYCEHQHTIAVSTKSEKIDTRFNGTIFAWNESLDKPTIASNHAALSNNAICCVFHKQTNGHSSDGCHIHINQGMYYGGLYNHKNGWFKTQPNQLPTVNSWPKPQPPKSNISRE